MSWWATVVDSVAGDGCDVRSAQLMGSIDAWVSCAKVQKNLPQSEKEKGCFVYMIIAFCVKVLMANQLKKNPWPLRRLLVLYLYLGFFFKLLLLFRNSSPISWRHWTWVCVPLAVEACDVFGTRCRQTTTKVKAIQRMMLHNTVQGLIRAPC